MNSNPVLSDYLADPFCFHHEGWYYAVATGKAEAHSPSFDGPCVVPMVKSRDLCTWERVGRVLELPPEPYTCFWAPEMTDRQMCVDRLDWTGSRPSIARFAVTTAIDPEFARERWERFE